MRDFSQVKGGHGPSGQMINTPVSAIHGFATALRYAVMDYKLMKVRNSTL